MWEKSWRAKQLLGPHKGPPSIDSSVLIATLNRLYDRAIEVRFHAGTRYLHLLETKLCVGVQTASSLPTSVNLSTGLKRTWTEADHSITCNAEVKNEWRYTSIILYDDYEPIIAGSPPLNVTSASQRDKKNWDILKNVRNNNLETVSKKR